MTLKADSHALSLPGKVDLYIVDLNPINVGITFYFYAGTDTSSAPINYQGNTYTPWIAKVTGIEKRGTGASARPSVEIANIGGVISQYCELYQDMVNATVIRRRTLSTYIAANIAEYQDDFYIIEQRTGETRETIKFDLSSPLDFLDKQLPGMVAIGNICPHQYKSTANGSGCSWPGTNSLLWFDATGASVSSSAADVCGKRISDCKLRFGANNPLDYGGNPGLGRSSN